jgi:phosphoglycolate phosphatase-like HAD superfamily hydrolase
MKKHIIFDLDGTLINSLPIMEKAWKVVTNTFNLNISFYEYKKYTGLPFDTIMNKLGLSSIGDEIKKVYFNETKKRSKEIKLIKGAKELILFLNKKEYLISIITSKPRKSFQGIKHLVPKCIDLVLCGDDTNFNKPDKNLINYLLSQYPNKTSNLTYIGDTIFL